MRCETPLSNWIGLHGAIDADNFHRHARLKMAPYLVVRIVSAVTRRYFDVRGAAAIGLGILFIFTGIGHFIQAEPMAQMLPPWVPQRTLLVYLTGALEFAIAVGFLVPKSTRFTGWLRSQCWYCSFQRTSTRRSTISRWAVTQGVRCIFSFERRFRSSSCLGCIGLRSGSLTRRSTRRRRKQRAGELGR